jgi:hypothetical protein
MMFRFTVSLLVVCTVMSGSPVAAQAADTVDPAVEALSAAQFADMRGEYQMDDGSVLTVDGVRKRPVAWLDQRGPIPLVVLGPNRLVSADGHWKLEFRAGADRFDAVILTRQIAAR